MSSLFPELRFSWEIKSVDDLFHGTQDNDGITMLGGESTENLIEHLPDTTNTEKLAVPNVETLHGASTSEDVPQLRRSKTLGDSRSKLQPRREQAEPKRPSRDLFEPTTEQLEPKSDLLQPTRDQLAPKTEPIATKSDLQAPKLEPRRDLLPPEPVIIVNPSPDITLELPNKVEDDKSISSSPTPQGPTQGSQLWSAASAAILHTPILHKPKSTLRANSNSSLTRLNDLSKESIIQAIKERDLRFLQV